MHTPHLLPLLLLLSELLCCHPLCSEHTSHGASTRSLASGKRHARTLAARARARGRRVVDSSPTPGAPPSLRPDIYRAHVLLCALSSVRRSRARTLPHITREQTWYGSVTQHVMPLPHTTCMHTIVCIYRHRTQADTQNTPSTTHTWRVACVGVFVCVCKNEMGGWVRETNGCCAVYINICMYICLVVGRTFTTEYVYVLTLTFAPSTSTRRHAAASRLLCICVGVLLGRTRIATSRRRLGGFVRLCIFHARALRRARASESIAALPPRARIDIRCVYAVRRRRRRRRRQRYSTSSFLFHPTPATRPTRRENVYAIHTREQASERACGTRERMRSLYEFASAGTVRSSEHRITFSLRRWW